MSFYRRTDDIVGYSYAADLYCPSHIAGAVDQRIPSTTDPAHAEPMLDTLAKLHGIDRMREDSYDSGEFPKVCFRSDVTPASICGICFDPLNA